MGVFDDKKYENLDWISQTTEPVESKLNYFLGKIPDRIVITFDMYRKNIIEHNWDDGNTTFRLHGLLKDELRTTYVPDLELEYSHINQLEKCFKFELTSDKVIIDFQNKTITGGELVLVKEVAILEDKDLLLILGKPGLDSLRYSHLCTGESGPRINDIMELLGKCEKGLSMRSENRKREIMMERLQQIFKENEWNIRDIDLADKICFWIKDYIVNKNLASYSTFCKFKVMTHKGLPIYSVEEVK